jgi:hypothetical protein
VFGYRSECTADGFAVDLPDLNRGVTAVVLATLTVDRTLAEPTSVRVGARIDYRQPASGAPRRVEVDETLSVDPRAGARLSDPEVRKNFTIAVLAQGMHDMAVAASASRWRDAEAVLRRALDFARRQYPGNDDEDLQRVRQMVEDQRRTLGRHLERFRDF